MYTDIEILSDDAFENVITALHFCVDKVLFFGTDEQIRKQRPCVERFLREVCHVEEICFFTLALYDMESAEEEIRHEIQLELDRGNYLFGDITGGSNAYVSLLTNVADDMDIPLHIYDIKKDRLTEMKTRKFKKLSRTVPLRGAELGIGDFISMYGRKINHSLGKHDWCYEHREASDVEAALWEVFLSFSESWNILSTLLNYLFQGDEDGYAWREAGEVRKALAGNKNTLSTEEDLQVILGELEKTGAICELLCGPEEYSFRYNRSLIPEDIWLGGGILEYHVFLAECRRTGKCMIGVHIDWDGEIHEQPGIDVLNEIDVVSLSGNVLTLISCKTGKAECENPQGAISELEMVAGLFGKERTKKILYVARRPAKVHMERAKNLGIEVRVVNK